MSYEKKLQEVLSLGRFSVKLGLRNITALLKELGNPHKNLKVIHVAGTNGKGSVCAMLRAILIEAGYNVGMYTSPYLVRFNERMQINNQEVTNDDVEKLIDRINPIVKILRKRGYDITFFEFTTAMAFQYFKEKKVDICLIEVGLGGRLDATNVVSPLLSIITNISLEHTKWLGNTVEKIAGEKAGIIKERVQVVTGCKGKALEVIKKKCKEKSCKLIMAKDHSFETNLLGEHQKQNADIAVAAMKEFGVDEKFIRSGLKKVVWPGRLELIDNILFDVAHNPAGMKTLKKALKSLKYKKLVLVLGISADKDIKEMLSIISPLANEIIVTKAKWRGAETKVLKNYINSKVVEKPKVSDAIKHAMSIADKDDLICITGSIFSVGEAKTYLDLQE